jgi:cyclophilin family peptidyl-prolyl cis-trans isomerase
MSFSIKYVRPTPFRGIVLKNTRLGAGFMTPKKAERCSFHSSSHFSSLQDCSQYSSAADAAAGGSSSHRRFFATGTRGSRGHGWYTNYRAGKGGRHLQGEYYERNMDECLRWNEAILEMGFRQAYFDVVCEPRSSEVVQQDKKGCTIAPVLEALSGEKHRLYIDLADTVMAETSANFIDLCLKETDGYKGSLLYRFERNVGACGGDVLTNTGRAGKAAHGSPLTYTVQRDPLAMWHVPGTITMLVARVGDIDSRFVLCTEWAPHLDGINRAFGRLTEGSLAVVKKWQSTLLTRNGVPSSYDLVVVGCGTVTESIVSSDVAA